ncbi:DUF2255 family protein [Mycobacterium sp. Y57]|uniref:DUF2255 family protein n=1 Tax=Mycolicibacterium xanthum TaxID=2796469 RepID=UPI001C8590E2|nr:DUF2255 family protein [Mycolicibacterium xanthum]MBX7430721.1 DUF2255 family protein [Mycolicibacterium xanthum]
MQITTLRRDGSARTYRPIWVVRCGDDLLVRSYRGADGGWYRHARQYPHGRIKVRGTEHDVSFAEAAAISTDVVDRAYRDKYGAGGYVDAMIRDGAASTTLTLTPES